MNNNHDHSQNGQMDQAHMQEVQTICEQYMNYLMQMQMQDGSMVEGIINGMDDEGVHMLVPDGENGDDQMRFYGGGFGGGYGGGYGYPRRFRRFRPFYFPYWGIRGFFFPFFI
ncbi:hypothetical protein [Alteribacter aurantiacus]|uniref:hypothetical protein n=1 Tax=Alteribacter aurantiacus TaxID=254410 RepID=UPI0003FF6061|nr:hypothetical protein [Alteribacter aurantiacus]